MKRFVIPVVAVLAAAGILVTPAAVGRRAGVRGQALALVSAQQARVHTLVSIRLAALGSTVHSPRGPFETRPRKISFDLGGYYGAGTKGLWIGHLKWVDWGQPVAYASGTVHARVWPTKKFMVTAGGIMLDKLESCGSDRFYYTSANMVVPLGFPQNTQSMADAINEQALAPS